jgi:hypoxanthine phosphoribosyltransferase
MNLSKELLLEIARDKETMRVLKSISELIQSIETVEWRVEHNKRQREKNDVVYYSETQQTLDSLKNRLKNGPWGSCICNH